MKVYISQLEDYIKFLKKKPHIQCIGNPIMMFIPMQKARDVMDQEEAPKRPTEPDHLNFEFDTIEHEWYLKI